MLLQASRVTAFYRMSTSNELEMVWKKIDDLGAKILKTEEALAAACAESLSLLCSERHNRDRLSAQAAAPSAREGKHFVARPSVR